MHGDQHQLRPAGQHGGRDEARNEQRDETGFGGKVEHSEVSRGAKAASSQAPADATRQVAHDLTRGVVTRRAGDATAGMRARAAVIQAFSGPR